MRGDPLPSSHEAHPLAGGGLHVHLRRRDAQRPRPAAPASPRPAGRSSGRRAARVTSAFPTRNPRSPALRDDLREQHERRDPLPARVGVREVAAQIPQAGRAQHRVADGVGAGVGVGVAQQPVPLELDPAQDELAARRRTGGCRSPTPTATGASAPSDRARARATSSGPVILKFPGSPGTSVTRSPSRSTSRHSSVAARGLAPGALVGAQAAGRGGSPAASGPARAQPDRASRHARLARPSARASPCR